MLYPNASVDLRLGHRHMIPPSRVLRGQQLLAHGPASFIALQPGAGQQHSATPIPVIEPVQRAHEIAARLRLILQIKFALLNAAVL